MQYSRILRLSEVKKRTGLSRSTIYELISKDQFPSQILVSERCVGWDEDAIQNWILEKLEQSKKQEALNV